MHAAFGFEGLRPYQAGRSRTWLNIKKQDVSSDVPADVRFRDLELIRVKPVPGPKASA
jgi:hypothetical protein